MHRHPRVALACLAAAAAAVMIASPAFAQRTRGKTPGVAVRSIARYTSVQELVAAMNGDIQNLPRLLRSGRVVTQLDRICAVAGENAVSCSTVDDIERFLNLAPEDGKLMRLGLNDFMSGVGLPSSDRTLFMCVGQGPQIGRAQFGSLAGSGGGLAVPSRLQVAGRARGPRSFTASAGASVPSHAPTMVDRSAMAEQCGSGVRTAAFGGGPRGTRAYGRAVSSAVGYMDRAMSQCRDQTSPIAQDAGGGTGATDSTPPAATDSTPPAKPDSTPPPPAPANQNPPPAGNAGERAINNVNTWFGLWAGGAELAQAVGTGNIPGAILAVAGLVAGADQVAADGTATDQTNDAVQAAGTTSTVVSLVVTVATEGTAAVAAGTAVAAVGAAAGTLAVVVPVTRWVDEKTGFGDAVVNKLIERKENSPEYRRQYGLDSKRPAPDGSGRLSCDEARAAWERFKAYCSQAGNNWQTYDCAKFVARLNGCADPAVVNPGPEGDYVCRGKPSERERAIAACEEARKKRDMIARPTGEARPSCSETVDQWFSLSANATRMRDLCTKVDGEDGLACPQAAPSGGGGSGAPRPAPRPDRRGS